MNMAVELHYFSRLFLLAPVALTWAVFVNSSLRAAEAGADSPAAAASSTSDSATPADEETTLGEHGFADSDGVKIHYVTKGEGPLVVLIHGFPDFWYTWREQMPALV